MRVAGFSVTVLTALGLAQIISRPHDTIEAQTSRRCTMVRPHVPTSTRARLHLSTLTGSGGHSARQLGKTNRYDQSNGGEPWECRLSTVSSVWTRKTPGPTFVAYHSPPTSLYGTSDSTPSARRDRR